MPASVIHSQDKINSLKSGMWAIQSTPSGHVKLETYCSHLTVTRHSDGHHFIISKADNGHFSSNSKCKILIPLQRVMGNYANVFKLDEKANLSDTPRFLDIRISRTTRQSLVIAPESLTSLFNTIREIGMENLLDGIQFESLTTLAVESFFKGMRSDHDMPRVLQYAYRRVQCVKDNMLRIYQNIFSYITGPNSNTAQRKSTRASEHWVAEKRSRWQQTKETEQSRGEAETVLK